VHITFGESSVFEKEAVPGSAAVYLMLKPGTTLEKNQIKSVMAIVFVEMFIDSSSEGSKIMTAELSKYRKGVNVLSINNIIVANK
ncbi:hypothetical protein ACTPEF_25875, partial [Clostridioides difficile]